MELVVSPSAVEGVARAPPSKSYTHRAVFAALLADGVSRVVEPLLAADTSITAGIVRGLGADTEWAGRELHVSSTGSLRWRPSLYCGESGTSLRIATAVASLLDRPVLLYGEEGLHRRPMRGLLDALRGAGVAVAASPGDRAPVAVRGPLLPGLVRVDAGESSQYLTALLIAGAGVEEGLEVMVERLESRPYVDVTVRVLGAFGVRVERDGYRWFRVQGPPRPTVFRVPGDWSSAAPLLAAGALAGRVRVENLDPDDPQPDRAVLDVLRGMGARVRVGDGWVETEKPGVLEAFEYCVADSPDLAPVLASLAAAANGVSRICCIGRLRLKESDRAEAIVSLLTGVGVGARVEGDCIIVEPRPVEPGRRRLHVYGDHRIAMMAALLALGLGVEIEIDQPEAVSKSYPGFWDTLRSLGVQLLVRQ